MEIIDTAGEPDYQDLLDAWIDKAEGFLLVFALDNYESFTNLKGLYQRICNIKNTNTPIVLLGNKCEIPENEKKVTRNEVEELAKSWGVQYLEVSSKTDCNGNIKLAFKIIAEKIIEFKEKQKPKQKQKSKKCYLI